jgi:pyruvate/2-oxoglutarate dehydrogenase complex dihydrolipoamide acyltransferase (E2) component
MTALVDVVLPESAWEGVEAGVQALLDRWLVAEGATVEAGQPLVRAVLVKSSMDIDSPVSGTLQAVAVPAGATFARGQVLARIAT